MVLPCGILHFSRKSISLRTYGRVDWNIRGLDCKGGHLFGTVCEREVASWGQDGTDLETAGAAFCMRETNIGLVEAMWGQFQNLGTYEAHVIDATDCSVQDTVSMIKEKIVNKTALLCRWFL